MLLPAALGLNLWMLAAVLPLAAAWLGPAQGPRPGLAWAIACAALAPLLLWGLRARSPRMALVGFPTAAALAQGIYRPAADALPPAAFFLTAASLVAYLGTASRWLGRAELGARTAPIAGGGPSLPATWRRRLRVYRVLAAMAGIGPLVLLGRLLLGKEVPGALQEHFGAQVHLARLLCTIAIGLLWVGVLRAYLLAPLRDHLHHDQPVRAALAEDRQLARGGRPRPVFYVAVAVAIGAMLAAIWLVPGAPGQAIHAP